MTTDATGRRLPSLELARECLLSFVAEASSFKEDWDIGSCNYHITVPLSALKELCYAVGFKMRLTETPLEALTRELNKDTK